MAEPHLFLCNTVTRSARAEPWQSLDPVHFNFGLGTRDIHLNIHHLTDKMSANASPVIADLLEIAAVVYAADQFVRRGGAKEFEYGQSYRRYFRFEIGVRRPEVWRQEHVRHALIEALSFLTDDDYEFVFSQNKSPRPFKSYLYESISTKIPFEEVLLFSGGLDSLGGAVQEVLNIRRPVALVSHRPTPKTWGRATNLVEAISDKCTLDQSKPLHIPIVVNKGKKLGRDFNQRSRSFLFAALAAGVARIAGLNRIRFYENGVTSLNPPLSNAILGGRASRTTHPQTLASYGKFFSLLFETDFKVENLFQWKTKAEIVELIKSARCGHLCAKSCSCVQTWKQLAKSPHCGKCTQCIDRRLTCLAANADDSEDPINGYESDVLTGRRTGKDWVLTASFVRTIRAIENCASVEQLLVMFPEISRALNYLSMPPNLAAKQVFELLKRHATQICNTLGNQVSQHSLSWIKKGFPRQCLLAIACGCEQPLEHERSFSADAITFDDNLFTVTVGATPCEMGDSVEFHILRFLADRIGKNVSQNDLLNSVWRGRRSRDCIYQAMSRIRKTLKSDGIDSIQIVSKVRNHYQLVFACSDKNTTNDVRVMSATCTD